MQNYRNLRSSTWARNTFWRILLLLCSSCGYKLCKQKKTPDGDNAWEPVEHFEISRDLLRVHNVDVEQLELEKERDLIGKRMAVK